MTATPQQTDWDNFWGDERSRKYGAVSWSKRRILSVLEPFLNSGASALDAGCGSGFFSKVFCDRGMKTVSLDFAQKALDMASGITGGQSRLVKADMLIDDIPDLLGEKFDIVFSDGLFEHFPAGDQDRIMRNFTGCMKDDGVVVTFVPNRYSPWELIRPFYMPGIDEQPFVMQGLLSLNERNGLSVVRRGGVNTIPFRFSPDRLLGQYFGMLLFTVSRKAEGEAPHG